MEASRDVVLSEGLLASVEMSDHAPGVCVRGRCTKGTRAWLVSLFLVNEQPKPHTNRDEAWLFQPTLTLTVDDYPAPFVGRSEAVAGDSGPKATGEQTELDLLFRHEVEFDEPGELIRHS